MAELSIGTVETVDNSQTLPLSNRGQSMNALITLNNNDNVDLFVTAVDHNLPGDPVCFPNQRINVGAAAPATVEIDGNNQFSITWTAVSTADPTRVKSSPATGGPGDPVPVASS
jgi:hypothetical protein